MHPAGRLNVEPLWPGAHRLVVYPRLARRITCTLMQFMFQDSFEQIPFLPDSVVSSLLSFSFLFPFSFLAMTISLVATRGTSTPLNEASTFVSYTLLTFF